LIAIRAAEFDKWCLKHAETSVSFFTLAHVDVKDMDELYTLMFQHVSNKKCATLMVTETRPKITALEFQGNFEDGNLR